MNLKTRRFDRVYLKTKGVILISLAIEIMFTIQAHAQVDGLKFMAGDNTVSLIVENAKEQRRAYFVLGQTISCKTRFSNGFEKALITGITDSTLSIQNGKNSLTRPFADFIAIKIPARDGEKAGGVTLTTLGSLLLAGSVALFSVAPDALPPANSLAIVLGIGTGIASVSMLTAGVGLLSKKKVNLGGVWSLRTTRAIVPGITVKVILKNGQVVVMKVTQIDSDKIMGEVLGSLEPHSMKILITDVITIQELTNTDKH